MVLSKNQPFLQDFWWVSRKKDPWQEWTWKFPIDLVTTPQAIHHDWRFPNPPPKKKRRKRKTTPTPPPQKKKKKAGFSLRLLCASLSARPAARVRAFSGVRGQPLTTEALTLKASERGRLQGSEAEGSLAGLTGAGWLLFGLDPSRSSFLVWSFFGVSLELSEARKVFGVFEGIEERKTSILEG